MLTLFVLLWSRTPGPFALNHTSMVKLPLPNAYAEPDPRVARSSTPSKSRPVDTDGDPQTSPQPSASISHWSGLAIFGQLSHASPRPSPSLSVRSGQDKVGQLSQASPAA